MEALPATCGTTVTPPLNNSAPRAYCNFQGIRCSSADQRVLGLNLTGSGLAFNRLPVELGNLTALTDLRKQSIQTLGTILLGQRDLSRL